MFGVVVRHLVLHGGVWKHFSGAGRLLVQEIVRQLVISGRGAGIRRYGMHELRFDNSHLESDDLAYVFRVPKVLVVKVVERIVRATVILLVFCVVSFVSSSSCPPLLLSDFVAFNPSVRLISP